MDAQHSRGAESALARQLAVGQPTEPERPGKGAGSGGTKAAGRLRERGRAGV